MKKNIWIFNHYATSMYKNKGGRHYWFADNLQKNGYVPTIFCSSQFHEVTEQIDLESKRYKVDDNNRFDFVFVKSSPYKGNGLSRVFNMFSFYKNLLSITKKYVNQGGRPDIILASSVHPLTLIAGIKIAKRYKVPCICEIRDLWPEAIFFNSNKIKDKSLIGKILTYGEHWTYKKADALIFTKEGDTDYLKERKWDLEQGGNINFKKCHYINNGVNIGEYKKSIDLNILHDEDLENSKFNVVYCGAIRPVNNVGQILDCAELLKSESEIQFLIYGEGSLLSELKEKVAKQNLTNVKLKGFVEKKYIPYILSKSSLNILNYSAEKYNWARGSSSNKLFEYMASGKPILSTVKMGYCIITKYNCGLSLDECTPQAMADAIIKVKNMHKDEYEKLGENAYNGAKDFDYEILTEKLLKVIESVVV